MYFNLEAKNINELEKKGFVVHFNLEAKNINELEKKLSGELPVTRDELIALVNSHGRKSDFHLEVLDKQYFIEKCEPKECYPLENLDVSLIDDFSCILKNSYYNGNLSKWKLSGDCLSMFESSDFNNDSLRDLDFKKIYHCGYMFYNSKFCGDISGWTNYHIPEHIYNMFEQDKNFAEKYNDGREIGFSSDTTRNWLDNNLDKIKEINTPKEDVLDYFNFDEESLSLER